MLVAHDLGLPELRPVFHLGLRSVDAPALRGALNGLTRIGWGKEDVPALIGLLGRDEQVLTGHAENVQTALFHLVALGADAAPALPAVEKLQGHPVDLIRESAARAAEKIKAASGGREHKP